MSPDPTTFASIQAETDWERPPFIDVSRERLNALIGLWSAGETVDRCDLIAKGGSNTNYLVSFAGRPTRFVMRLYASDPHGWRKEPRLHGLLGASVPMPRVVYSGIAPDIADYPITVFEFVEGQTLLERMASGQIPTLGLIRQIARSLALIHRHHYDEIGALDEDLQVVDDLPPFDTWIELFLNARATERLGAEVVDRYRALVEARRADIGEIASWTALVHGDYRPTNLLVRGDDLAAVIDWEFAMADHPFSDLGQIIRHGWMTGAMESEFVSVYNEISTNPLPGNWKQLARLRDSINLVQLIGSRIEKPRMQADLRRLILSVIEQS